jgi:hypothetical protein
VGRWLTDAGVEYREFDAEVAHRYVQPNAAAASLSAAPRRLPPIPSPPNSLTRGRLKAAAWSIRVGRRPGWNPNPAGRERADGQIQARRPCKQVARHGPAWPLLLHVAEGRCLRRPRGRPAAAAPTTGIGRRPEAERLSHRGHRGFGYSLARDGSASTRPATSGLAADIEAVTADIEGEFGLGRRRTVGPRRFRRRLPPG